MLRFRRFKTFKSGRNWVWGCLAHLVITPSQSRWSHFASSHTTSQSMPVVPFPIQHMLYISLNKAIKIIVL
ncbi:KxYKxGKxW signal peptide domain-containing protein [Yersinia enterocolitica]